jgi:hypothetical protein
MHLTRPRQLLEQSGTSRALLMTALCFGCGEAAPPAPSALVCASGMHWRLGDQESPVMHPGMSCNSCHAEHGAELFAVAGTVYAADAPEDADDCFGLGSASVVISDANGMVFTFTSNASGNFSADPEDVAIALPYRAKVIVGADERAMETPQSSGDCNACHTAAGANGASGRILAPLQGK